MNAAPVLPVYIQLTQLIGTFFLALFAAMIAYRQWRTAHQRLVFDLFERRMRIFDDAREVLNGVIRAGDAQDHQVVEFSRVAERARFLFGDEVVLYIEDIKLAVNDLCANRLMLRSTNLPPTERAKYAEDSAKCMNTIAGFYTKFPRLILPYVRMTQRMG